MMRSAELNHPSREEQILQKQQILEELQRVERELQEKAHAQMVLSGHHHLGVVPTQPCEEVEELNLRNAALSSSPSSPPASHLPSASTTVTPPVTAAAPLGPAAAKRHLEKAKPKALAACAPKETACSLAVGPSSPLCTASPSSPCAQQSPPGAPRPPSLLGPVSVGVTAPTQADEGLMVAAPARTLHETLGEIVSGGSCRSSVELLFCTERNS